MNKEPQLGKNRTGMAMSPVDSAKLMEGLTLYAETVGDEADAVAMRSDYITESEPLGSVPPPATLSGAMSTGLKMVKGSRPHLFLDKLAERAAFERGGTRLYDALITKFGASEDVPSNVDLEDLLAIRADEAAHYQLLAEAITRLGGDPTAQTPSADVVGIETMGLMQTVNDPRTTFRDCLHAMLTAELTDVEGWTLLTTLAESFGEDELAELFREALLQENHHLQQVRAWHQAILMSEI